MDNMHLCGKMAKVCGVCGDKAKSFHFGGISCDSCKAFFRRSVQNEVYKHFHCPHNGQCRVSMSSRKSCQFCRFEKCLSIGMMKNWVMSEDERQRLHQLRLQKKLSEERKRKTPETDRDVSSATFLHEHLSSHELSVLCELTNAYQSLLCADEFFSNFNSPLTFTRKILKLIHFARCVPEFKILSPFDQSRLLHNSLYEMSLAVGACSHRPSTEALQQLPYSGSCSPASSYSSISSSCSSNESDDEYKCDEGEFEPLNRLSRKLFCFAGDFRPFVLFLLVVLFNPDDSSLVDGARVAAIREWYCDLLRRYLEWKIGTRKATVVFAHLLLLLPELCEMKEKQSENFLFGRVEDWEQATSFIQSSDCL